MGEREVRSIGRFEITAEVGRGSQAVVHRARDPQADRDVALKTILWPNGISEQRKKQFNQCFDLQMGAVESLSHPGIVTVYEFHTGPETGPYIAMELVEGPSLHDVICREGLRVDWALQAADDLADALQSAREHGVAHPDLKPANILVRESDGAVKISDFGIARVDPVMADGIPAVPGKPAYIAPERVEGRPGDIRSDLFSLAVILYEMLCGELPFEGESAWTMCEAISHEPPVPISERVPDFDRAFDDFFERALAKEPESRFPDARAFREAIRRLRTACENRIGERTRSAALLDDIEVPCEEPGSPGREPTVEPSAPDDRDPTEDDTIGVEQAVPEDVAGALGLRVPSGAIPDLDDNVEAAQRKTEDIWLWSGIAALILLIALAAAWVAKPDGARNAAPKDGTPSLTGVVAPLVEVEPAPTPGVRRVPTDDPEPPELAPAPEPPPEQAATVTVEPAPAAEPKRVSASVREAVASEIVDPAPPDPVEVDPTPPEPVELEPASDPVAPVASLSGASPVVVPPLEPARLALTVKSDVKAGDLSVLVDGEEVYSTVLVSESKGFARIAKKAVRRGGQELESTVDLDPGPHTITARLYTSAKDKVFEESVDLTVEPGEQRGVRVIAGRTFGPKLTIKLDE